MSNLFARRPALRWLVPAVAASTAVGVAAAWPGTKANADGLPSRSAQQLLVDVQTARVPGLSGTVAEQADLGLPDLSGLGAGGGATGTSLQGLLTGSHTARVWTRGETMSRVAIQAQSAETDVVRSGRDVWQWSSAERTVEHTILPDPATMPASRAHGPHTSSQKLPSHQTASRTPVTTPQDAARRLLAMVGPTTEVSTAANDMVAGRPAYELVLRPRQQSSRVAQVRIAIDGQTRVPVRVQVYSTTTGAPALQVGFTQVSFAAPAASVFAFTPPAGAKVTTHDASKAAARPASGQKDSRPHRVAGDRSKPTITGVGWAQIATGRLDPKTLASSARMLALLPTVKGSWGSAHVLDGTLVSVVVTADGRYAVGAVAPSALEAALPAK